MTDKKSMAEFLFVTLLQNAEIKPAEAKNANYSNCSSVDFSQAIIFKTIYTGIEPGKGKR